MKYKKLFFIMFVVILFIAILTGSVAYYRTTIEGKIIGSTGNAVFNVTGLADSNTEKVIDLGNKLLPGDRGSFDIALDSTGSTVDMYVTLKISRDVLPSNLKFYSTSDYKSEISTYYSFLEISSKKSETLTIYWYWNPFIDNNDDNKYVGKNLSAKLSIGAKQISEYATMKNGYNAESEFWSNAYKPYIRTITFDNDLSNLPNRCTEDNLCWNLSYDQNQKKKVYGYLIDSGLKDVTDTTKSLYNLYIVSEAPIFAPSNCMHIFDFSTTNDEGFTNLNLNLNEISFNDIFNTSKTTNMSGMFFGNSALKKLDLSSFNTSNVNTRMDYLFANCKSLEYLDLSSFNTSKVTDMYSMFSMCSSLIAINLNSFNTVNVTNMSNMFYENSSLKNVNISSFNTSNVTNMKQMFYKCSFLLNLDLRNFNTSKVTNMSGMFSNCSSITNIDLDAFNTINVTDMSYMFQQCKALTILELSSFNTSNVNNMWGMFDACASLLKLDLSNFNTSKVINMRYMFGYCSTLKELDLSGFNTSSVTNMSYMFYGCSELVDLNISNFNTSKVTNMEAMFGRCFYLCTTINIMNSNIANYSNMFNLTSTKTGSKTVINYIASANILVDNMIATKSESSKVSKGKQI